MPLTNPTSGADVSDAGGWFPQIFAAEGTIVDITLKNAAGSTIKTYVDVVFLGSDDGTTFERDFTNSRAKISGSGGLVSFEAGDPSPDNTGGQWRIGGWATTQADTGELDAAVVNATGDFDVDGTLTASGGKSVDVALASGAQTAATNLDIPLTGSHRSYRLELLEMVGSGTNAMFGRLSTDNGSTYLSTTIYDNSYQTCSSGSVVSGGANSETSARISVSNLTTTAGDESTAVIDIDIPASGTGKSRLSTRCDIGTVMNLISTQVAAGARPTHIRIFSAAGTWTGRYRLTTRKD